MRVCVCVRCLVGRPRHDGSQVYNLIDSEVGERIGTITLRLRGRRPQPSHGGANRPRPTVVVDLVSLQRQYMQLRRSGRLPTDNLHHFFATRAGPDRGVDGSMSALAFERAVLALGLDLSKSVRGVVRKRMSPPLLLLPCPEPRAGNRGVGGTVPPGRRRVPG